MNVGKNFKKIFLNVIAGLIVVAIVQTIIFFTTSSQIDFSWIDSPLAFLEKMYFSYSIPMRFNIFIWIMVFFFYYILEKYDAKFEISKKRKVKEQNFNNRIFGLYSFFVGFGLLKTEYLSFRHTEFDLVFDIAGIVLTVIGFIILILGRMEIDGFWGPHIYEYTDPNLKRLIQTGIYSKMRHPIYWGQSVLAFATFVSSGTYVFIVFPLIVIIINSIRAINEEKNLELEFGEEFKKYQGKVKKWLWY